MIALIVIFVLLAVGVAAFFIFRKKASPAPQIIVQPDVVSLLPAAWVASYSAGVKILPATAGTGWYFDFPAPPGHVNYVMVPYHANKAHTRLTIKYRIRTISGTPVFNSLDPYPPGLAPNCRPMLERSGDTLSASQEFYRWWSNPGSIILAPSIGQLTVLLTPDEWSSVFGKFGTAAPASFDAALKDLMGVGLTFGGGEAFGHGVNVSGGTARFELIDYQLT